jgi:hypothetical protein
MLVIIFYLLLGLPQTVSPGFFQQLQVTEKSFIWPFFTPPTAPCRVAALGT